MTRSQFIAYRTLLLAAMLIGMAGWAAPQNSPDALAGGFKNPPASAKPRAWWHWLNGNVTKEGITADLEWMKKSGIAGMQMFDGNLNTPIFVDKRLVWMTPAWKDAFRHAGAEADRLGLEMAMAASGGWSETAGPWVKPEEAMKKIVWSKTVVEGPRHFSGVLAHPPTVNGKFENIASRPGSSRSLPSTLPGAKPMPPAPPPKPDLTFYADSKVVAYRLPEGEEDMAEAHPKVTTSAADVDAAKLTDGDVADPVMLAANPGESSVSVQLEFDHAYTAEAATLAMGSVPMFGGSPIPEGEIQSSQDGTHWLTLVSLPGPSYAYGNFPVATYSFPRTTAKFYRVVLRPPAPNPLVVQRNALEGIKTPVARGVRMAEIEFSGPRVTDWEGKAAFADAVEFRDIQTPRVPQDEAVPVNDVIDLTSKMKPGGSLDWDVPAGKWVILRMGYSLTGTKNHPASPEATGYEVDKLSAKHVHDYVKTYVNMVSGALGPYFGKSFQYFLMDSWEAGVENWTDNMIPDFQRLRGYDPTPYLPVLTGRIVGSAKISDRFLWDFRRTIADLLAENHYGVATKYFTGHGLKGLYAEAMGVSAPTTGDGLLNKGQVTIPMGEFWTPPVGMPDGPEHFADLKEASSAAHIYGKPFAGAESFTTRPNAPVWSSPYYLKPLGDHAMALGINRFVFHTSDQQPFVDSHHKPGMTLGPFGQHYTRNVTWADEAWAWNLYLARCSYLLQQGRYVAQLAYFYGEGAPATVPFWKRVRPAPPEGYSYDWLDADVLLNKMSFENGRLVLPSGMRYRVLVFPDYVNEITLPVLRKIQSLVSEGALVAAPRPLDSPSLADYANRAEFHSIVDEMWGSTDGMGRTEHDYGKGKIYWGRPLAEVLAANTPPDFEHNRPEPDTNIVWIHRHDGEADIYFVANQREHSEDLEASFLVEGKQAELWHPATGAMEPADYKIEDGRTAVPLHLDPYGSVFVVFRKKAAAPSRTLPHAVAKELATVSGPWQVSFPPDWGAPPEIKLDKLISWTDDSHDGVKYFSGTATYSKTLEIPKAWFQPGAKLVLDLGKVDVLAQVAVNGQAFKQVLWKPPFQIDITRALKPGMNHLEFKVTNLWPNRIIGDQQPNAKKQYAWLDYRPYRADTPLLKSGLLGPVRILAVALRR